MGENTPQQMLRWSHALLSTAKNCSLLEEVTRPRAEKTMAKVPGQTVEPRPESLPPLMVWGSPVPRLSTSLCSPSPLLPRPAVRVAGIQGQMGKTCGALTHLVHAIPP